MQILALPRPRDSPFPPCATLFRLPSVGHAPMPVAPTLVDIGGRRCKMPLSHYLQGIRTDAHASSGCAMWLFFRLRPKSVDAGISPTSPALGKLWPNCGQHFHQHRANLSGVEQIWAMVSRIWANLGRIRQTRPNLDRSCQTMGRARPTLGQIRSKLATLGTEYAGIGWGLANCGTEPGNRWRVPAECGQTPTNMGPFRRLQGGGERHLQRNVV